MPESDRVELVRDSYRAYESRDRAAIERLIADDFVFSSPADVGIDRAAYFERCWPNAQALQSFGLTGLDRLTAGARIEIA